MRRASLYAEGADAEQYVPKDIGTAGLFDYCQGRYTNSGYLKLVSFL